MRIKFLIGSVLVLIGAYSFFWYSLAQKAEQTTLDWIEHSESRLGGIKSFVGDVEVSGFPYRIVVEASSFNAEIPAGRIGQKAVSINVPEVSVVFQPWEPNHAIVMTDYFDAVVGSLQNPDLTVNFDGVRSSVIFDPSTMSLNNLSAVFNKIDWYPNLDQQEVNVSHLENAEFHLRRTVGEPEEQMSYDLPINRAIYFKASNARIRELATTILGEKADEIKVEALLHANEQPGYTKKDLAKWRDEGGTMSIRTFEYGSSDSAINLSGDVTLDENFKPLGAFDANVTGIADMFSKLAENEELPEITRALLRGQAQNQSLPGEVPLSISMQNGQLYVGPIMLMELPVVIE